MTTYKINGREVSKEEWCRFKEDGIHQMYYPSGQLACEEIWVNGRDRTKEFKDNKLAQVVVFGRVIL